MITSSPSNSRALVAEIHPWDERLLRSIYERLEDRAGGGWFLTEYWIDAWLTTLDRNAEKRLILLFNQGDTLACGMLPLFRATRWSPWRILGDESVTCPDHLDLVIWKGQSAAGWRAVLETISKSRQLAYLELDHLDGGSELPAVVRDFKRSNWLATAEIDDSRPCYRIDLRGGWDAVSQGLSSKMRSNIKRTEQRIAAELNLSFEALASKEERLQALVDLVHLHSERWSARGQKGAFGQSELESLLRFIICADGAIAEKLRMFRLRTSQKTIGVLLGFIHEDSFLFYTTGFDFSMARYSPGMILVARTIQYISASGIHTFDFLRGDEVYKSQWSKSVRKDVRVRLYFGWMGVMFRGANVVARLWGRFKSRLGRALRRGLESGSKSFEGKYT